MERKKSVFQIAFFTFAVIFLLFSLARTVTHYGSQVLASVQQPFLVPEPFSHDFGKVNSAEGTKKFSFIVKNKGRSPLIIENVSSECGSCVKVVNFTNTPIPPKGKGTIDVELQPQNLSGKVRKQIMVRTNASTYNTSLLTLEAEIVHPDNVNSEPVDTDTKTSETIK